MLEFFKLSYGEFWYILFPISFIITWTIGLLPPILLSRYLFKKPINKWPAISIVVVLMFINVVIFVLLGSTSKTHAVLVIIAGVSYKILTNTGFVKNTKMSKRATNKDIKPVSLNDDPIQYREHYLKTNPYDTDEDLTQLQELYNITFENDKYQYKQYKYEKLMDAINYAKMQDSNIYKEYIDNKQITNSNIQDRENYLKSNSDDADILNKSGMQYGEKGFVEKEIECYKKAIEKNPAFTSACLNLAITDGENNQSDITNQLITLKKYFDNELIDKEEYKLKKKQILGL